MSKWVIDKTFSFCYGHRVWSQLLNKEFCDIGDCQAKCRHLHGHEGLVHVFLEGETLERGMVTDFKHLGWLKNFIDSVLDHRFIIDADDPMYHQLVACVYKDLTGRLPPTAAQPDYYLKPIYIPGTDVVAAHELDMEPLQRFNATADFEVLQGYVVVDFVPTSENLSKWIYNVAATKMAQLGVKVSQVDWYETPRSRSSYRG